MRLSPQPVFSVDGHGYGWAEVVVAARHWGLWSALMHDTVAATRVPVDPGLSARARELQQKFRSDRQLFAADDLRAWLRRWGLSVEEWKGHLVRQAALEREPPTDGDCGGPEAEEETLVDAVCSGCLERWGKRLAEAVALWREQHGERLGGSPTLDQLDAAMGTATALASTPAALERELRASFLLWTRVDCDWVSDDRVAVMRELSYCVREDGAAMRDACRTAGLELRRDAFYLEQTHSPLLEHLLAARRGDLVGPLEINDTLWLVAVLEKHPPSLADDRVERWAIAAGEERLANLASARHVDWHRTGD